LKHSSNALKTKIKEKQKWKNYYQSHWLFLW
jgi:hypothetical protein